MLYTHQSDMGTKLVLTPNRSLSWTGNKWVIASLATLCLSIGIMMTVIHGAWVILPMAGMEILLFGSALFYVSRRLSYRQVICLQHQHIVIEKGYYRPRRHWRLPRHQVQLQIQPPQHDWEASSLALCCCRSERIESGERIEVANALEVAKTLEMAKVAVVKNVLISENFCLPMTRRI